MSTTQTKSGPHAIDDKQRQTHTAFKAKVKDLLPIPDRFKINDDDLLFRFLIAHQYDMTQAETGLRAYIAYRAEYSVEDIFFGVPHPAPVRAQMAGYHLQDKQGRPVYYERPDPSQIAVLLKSQSKMEIIQWHIAVAELGRRKAKEAGVDRITVVMDLTKVGISSLSNPSAVKMLKEMAHIDQHSYPENMFQLCIINPPRSFSMIWRIVSPFLAERVQKKIRILDKFEQLFDVVPFPRIPRPFGGMSDGFRTVDVELREEAAKLRDAAQKQAAATASSHGGSTSEEEEEGDDEEAAAPPAGTTSAPVAVAVASPESIIGSRSVAIVEAPTQPPTAAAGGPIGSAVHQPMAAAMSVIGNTDSSFASNRSPRGASTSFIASSQTTSAFASYGSSPASALGSSPSPVEAAAAISQATSAANSTVQSPAPTALAAPASSATKASRSKSSRAKEDAAPAAPPPLWSLTIPPPQTNYGGAQPWKTAALLGLARPLPVIGHVLRRQRGLHYDAAGGSAKLSEASAELTWCPALMHVDTYWSRIIFSSPTSMAAMFAVQPAASGVASDATPTFSQPFRLGYVFECDWRLATDVAKSAPSPPALVLTATAAVPLTVVNACPLPTADGGSGDRSSAAAIVVAMQVALSTREAGGGGKPQADPFDPVHPPQLVLVSLPTLDDRSEFLAWVWTAYPHTRPPLLGPTSDAAAGWPSVTLAAPLVAPW